MFFQSYHKPTPNKNDEYQRIDTAAIAVAESHNRNQSQSQAQNLALGRGGAGSSSQQAFNRPTTLNAPASVNSAVTVSGRYNLLPLKSLASIFNNQILSLAKFDGNTSSNEDKDLIKSAYAARLAEDERVTNEQTRQLADEQDVSNASATDSNEDFMKFTEIFNYLSEEEDFEPSSSSSSSPSPTPSTSPLSSTFSLSLSASNSSMSSLRVKAKVVDEQLANPPDSASILNESVHKQELDVESVCSKKINDIDSVSIDSLPLSSALSSSLMSVNTISSSGSAANGSSSGEYSSSLPITSNLTSLPTTITSADGEKPSADLTGSETFQKSLSTSTPALSTASPQLSLTKPSPEFVVESVLGLSNGNSSLKSKSIWSSALYLPCLHPTLFELNSAHSVSCLSNVSDSKLLSSRKYDLTPQAPTPCLSWSCMLEANDFNPFNKNNSNYDQTALMNAGSADLNLKFLNENRFAFNNSNNYNADHNDFINFKSLAQLRNNLNFINKYFQSNYPQMNEFGNNRGYNHHQQSMNDVEHADFFANGNQGELGNNFQPQNESEFGANSFGNNSNFSRMNNGNANMGGSGGGQNNSANYNNANHTSYFNSNYRNNAFNRSSKRRYRNNGFQFNQQYQSGGSSSYQQGQRNSLIIDDSGTSFYGHSYESDSLPSSNRHSMIIGSDADFDVYKLKPNLKNGEDMGSLPILTSQDASKMGSICNLDGHHSLNKSNDDSQQQLNEYNDSASLAGYNDFSKMSGRTMSNKFLAPRFEKKWMDQYQNGNNSGFYSSQKDDMSLPTSNKGRNHSFKMPNNNSMSNSMPFNGKFFTMPAKKNSNNFNYNSQFNLNASGNGNQQQQTMSTSSYSNGAPTTSTTSSSSATSPTSSPPTRHMLRRQNAIRLNHNQRYQHSNNYQFQSNSNQSNKPLAGNNNQLFHQAPACGNDCQSELGSYNSNNNNNGNSNNNHRYHNNNNNNNHHHYGNGNQLQSQTMQNNNSRYRSIGLGMTANTGAAANKTCRC